MAEWSTPSRRNKYPWHEWTDGQYQIAFLGIDFERNVEGFRIGLHVRARNIGLRVATMTIKPGNPAFGNPSAGIMFRFLRPGDESFDMRAGYAALAARGLLNEDFVRDNPRLFVSA